MVSTKKKSLTRSATLTMLVTFIGKFIGFGREALLAAKFGTSYELDAFILASTLPIVLFLSIGWALKTTFIPIYIEYRKKSEQEAFYFASNVINVFCIILIAFVILMEFLAYQITALVGRGFGYDTLILSIKLFRYMLPIIIFLGLSYFLMALLESFNAFLISASSNICISIITVLPLLLAYKETNILGFSIITTFSYMIQNAFLSLFLFRKGFQYKFVINLRDPSLKKMVSMMIPVIISTSIKQLNTIIDRSIASWLPAGSITALNYANKVINLPISIIIMPIYTVSYPLFSNLSAINEIEKLKKTVYRIINVMFLVSIPLTITIVVFRVLIIKILFERGAFTQHSTVITSEALFYYSFYLIIFGVRDILIKTFYSLQDSKTPMYNGIITAILNIALNLLLVKYMDHRGLALATSISLYVSCFFLFVGLKRKVNIDVIYILKGLVKITFASGVYFFLIYIINYLIKYYDFWVLCLLLMYLGVCFIIYLFTLKMLKSKEVEVLLGKINNILHGNKGE